MVRGRISYADDDFFHIENDLSNDVVVPRKHLVFHDSFERQL